MFLEGIALGLAVGLVVCVYERESYKKILITKSKDGSAEYINGDFFHIVNEKDMSPVATYPYTYLITYAFVEETRQEGVGTITLPMKEPLDQHVARIEDHIRIMFQYHHVTIINWRQV